MRILVVEDDHELAGMLDRALVASGFRVDSASDGRAGLRKALSVLKSGPTITLPNHLM